MHKVCNTRLDLPEIVDGAMIQWSRDDKPKVACWCPRCKTVVWLSKREYLKALKTKAKKINRQVN